MTFRLTGQSGTRNRRGYSNTGNRMAENLKDVDDQTRKLIIASRDARESAYCPYSKFKVGAALLTDTGEIITGCNVENCTYGLAICAERTAFVKAISEGKKNFVAAAVCAEMGETFVGPCGACRQTFVEFCEDIPIYLCRPNLTFKKTSSDTLMPDSFSPRWVKFEGAT